MSLKAKIISCVGDKGGIGKTTLNLILATNIVAKGKRVLLIDLDNPQYSVFRVREIEISEFSDEEKSKLDGFYDIVKGKTDNVGEIVKDNYKKYDVIIIDFPGNLNKEMAIGLHFVEYVFIPLSADELEINSTFRFYSNLKQYYLDNPNALLSEYYLFFNKYERVKKNRYLNLENAFRDKGYNMLKSKVLSKTIYTDKYRSSINPIPDNKENDKGEIKEFINEILDIIKL